MISTVRVTVATEDVAGRRLLAPTGIPTPYQTPQRFSLTGGRISLVGETGTGQMAAVITPDAGYPVTVTYVFAEGGSQYPEAMFRHRPNRFTRAAEELVADARRIADNAGDGHAGINAIVNEVAAKFDYGHPDTRFNDGSDSVPLVHCGLAEGSCIDINTYLIAALRAAGFEVGYVTGYFFPMEKNGVCDDMHCWVVTRHAGVELEWDIAHHLKLGTREICCGLNPKPGARVAIAHSMGLDFPELGISELKLLAEPVWVDEKGVTAPAPVSIRAEPKLAGSLSESDAA